MRTVSLRFGRMPKAQEFQVHDTDAPRVVVLTSEHAIAEVNLDTGQGLYHPHGSYRYDLDEHFGARRCTLTPDQTQAIQAAREPA